MPVLRNALLLCALGAADCPQSRRAPAPKIEAAGPAARRVRLEKSRIKVVDGDSLLYAFTAADGVPGPDGQPYAGEIRLVGFDTAETAHPEMDWRETQPFSEEATEVARRAVAEADAVVLVTAGGFGKYGRLLGHVYLDGVPLGRTMLALGLAYPLYDEYPADLRLFPDLRADLAPAWEKSPLKKSLDAGEEPAFIHPGAWRARQREAAARRAAEK